MSTSEKKGPTKENLGALLVEMPKELRCSFSASRIKALKIKELETTSDKCSKCWLIKRFCCCSSDPPLNINHNLLILMHHKEIGRMSNTAVTLLETFKQASLFISDVQEDENSLSQIIQDNSQNTIVLSPSPTAISIKEFVAKNNLNLTESSLNIIIIDGTWGQAKRLSNKSILRDLPHIKLDTAGLTMSTLRTQTKIGRVTTAEAVTYLLMEMGEDETVTKVCFERLSRRIRHAEMQKGLENTKNRSTKVNTIEQTKS